MTATKVTNGAPTPDENDPIALVRSRIFDMENNVCTARGAAGALYALAVDSNALGDDSEPSDRGVTHLSVTLFNTIERVWEEWNGVLDEMNRVPRNGAGQPTPVNHMASKADQTHRRRPGELEDVSIEITGLTEALLSMTFDLEEHDGRRKGFTCVAEHLSEAARTLAECLEGASEGAS